MKKFFYNIERRLLVTKPVIWISSVYWILGLCLLLIVVEVAIGLTANFATDLKLFYACAMVILVGLLFLWIAFQFRNYDKIFTIRQTFRIYLYNILSYFFICTASLVLLVIMSLRFDGVTNPEKFSRDLLSIRIANLRTSDIDLIVNNPQLFTSQGGNNPSVQSDSINLQEEYESRASLERNPLIKKNLYARFGLASALRKIQGYEYLSSVMDSLDKTEYAKYNLYSEAIDEDPIFYKYMKSLSSLQLDSLRAHSKEVIEKYGLFKPDADTSSGTLMQYHSLLQGQISMIEGNCSPDVHQISLTVMLLLIVCSVTFNFILTKNMLCLFTPFVYGSLVTLLALSIESMFRSSLGAYIFVISNVVLFGLLLVTLKWRHKIHSRNALFFIHQMLNLSALTFFVIWLGTTIDTAKLSGIWKIVVFIIGAAGFLTTHYFFIRKMHHTLIQET